MYIYIYFCRVYIKKYYCKRIFPLHQFCIISVYYSPFYCCRFYISFIYVCKYIILAASQYFHISQISVFELIQISQDRFSKQFKYCVVYSPTACIYSGFTIQFKYKCNFSIGKGFLQYYIPYFIIFC